MKRLLALALALVSSYSYAVDAYITKVDAPDNVVVVPGTGLAQFSLITSNFPSGTGLKTKTLQGIDWSTTSYPNNTEWVELCYYRPYNNTAPVGCEVISASSSGTVNTFNSQSFGPGASVIIRHHVLSGQKPAYPAGTDTVTFRYSY
jgi:hypothetical protein